jgi:hypothetical protein
MTTSMINLNALLKQAIASAREDESLTVEQIIAAVLSGDKVCVELPTISIGVAEVSKRGKSAAPAKEVKTRTRAAPAKPRSVPDDDVRCSARSFYEDQHLEDGLLKVMRDDGDNLYGDRCKFKKTGETDFCKHHGEKQPLGVWGSEYAGKFKTAVEKTEGGAAPAPKKEAKPKVVAEKKPVATKSEEYAAETEDEEEPEVESVEVEVKVVAKAVPAAEKPKGKPAPKVEEPAAEDAEVEDVEIDGVTYLIDPSDGTVYDHDSEEEVGRYNIKGKKWIVKPTA